MTRQHAVYLRWGLYPLRKTNWVCGAVLLMLLFFCAASTAKAATVKEMVRVLLESNEQILTATEEVRAARSLARATLGEWFPQLDLTMSYGEHGNHDGEGSVPTSESKVELSQLLWDFGATNASIRAARLRLEEKELLLKKARQQLLLDGVTSYINLIKTHQVLAHSIKSEQNIKRQTGLEELRVSSGAGYSTDLLQSQAQLAAAKSRRLLSEGEYLKAENRFIELFGNLPPNIPRQGYPRLGSLAGQMPGARSTALSRALKDNIDLRLAKIADQLAKEELRRTQSSELGPTIKFVVEHSDRMNDNGVLDTDKEETIAKVELTMPFNLGLTAFDKIDAAKAGYAARTNKTVTLAKTTERQVRDGWQQLRTAKLRAHTLREQSKISAAFLDLARKERELGNRSLLDVLSGETALINAQSDSVAARADILISTLNLLDKLGQLSLEQL